MRDFLFRSSKIIKIVLLSIILSIGVSYVSAQWVGPSANPPSSNTSAPLNTGTSDQTKTGGLLSTFNMWINSALGVTGGATFGGSVAVGTTSPFSSFHVYNGDITLGSNDGASAPTLNNGRSIFFRNYFLNGTGRTIATIFSGWSTAGSAADSHLSFSTEGSNVLAERMRITSTGNVGIGTTSPSAKLEVVGEVKGSTVRTTGQMCINSECYSSWSAVFAAYSNVNASLTASPTTVTSGQSSTLTWTSTNASLCVASGNWSGYVATAGSTSTGAVTSNRSYTLVCGNLAGSSTPQVATVSLTAPATITSFTATPSSISYNSSATLNWTSSNATSCTASNGWSGTKGTSGSESTGALTSSRTYGLTCTGPGGSSALSNVTVTVGAPPAPAITSFSASPNPVGTSGNPTTLSWSSSNTTSCTASNAWSGAKATAGSEGTQAITYPNSYTFTLTCSGPGGTTAPSSVVVTAPDPGPPVSCFIAGTTVMLANGTSKSIEEVKIGDMLLGENGSSNEVLGFLHHTKPKSKVYGFNGEKPFATEDHAFMTTGGWKSMNPEMTKVSSPNLEVNKLKVGDTLITKKGFIKVDSIDIGEIESGEMVYNFILGGNHTYYANGYLVSDYYNR